MILADHTFKPAWFEVHVTAAKSEPHEIKWWFRFPVPLSMRPKGVQRCVLHVHESLAYSGMVKLGLLEHIGIGGLDRVESIGGPSA